MNNEYQTTFHSKYWVVHDKTSDDVFLETASKSRDYTIIRYCEKFETDELGNIVFEHFYENDNLACDIIEVMLYETE